MYIYINIFIYMERGGDLDSDDAHGARVSVPFHLKSRFGQFTRIGHFPGKGAATLAGRWPD